MIMENNFIKNEVKSWLNCLYGECTIDETGKKALEILENEKELDRITKCIENDEEVWSTFYRAIEYYMFHKKEV